MGERFRGAIPNGLSCDRTHNEEILLEQVIPISQYWRINSTIAHSFMVAMLGADGKLKLVGRDS